MAQPITSRAADLSVSGECDVYFTKDGRNAFCLLTNSRDFEQIQKGLYLRGAQDDFYVFCYGREKIAILIKKSEVISMRITKEKIP